MSAPTRDEVIQMALEAGGTVMQPYDYGASPDRIVLRYETLERLVAAAYARGAAAEREACARICDDMTAPADIQNATARSRYLAATDDCAAAIRARGQV